MTDHDRIVPMSPMNPCNATAAPTARARRGASGYRAAFAGVALVTMGPLLTLGAAVPPAGAAPAQAPAPAVSSRPASVPVAWREVGRSVQGRPLRATTIGTGPRRVLWIGGIHGDEQEGKLATAEIIQAVAADPLLPSTVTLTVLEDANPDGRALNRRTNANGVDLNRNFPAWNFDHTRPEYGGTPLSQPESRVVDSLLTSTRPDLVIVLHSWLGRQFINYDGTAAGMAARWSAKSGMPLEYVASSSTPGSLGTYLAQQGMAGLTPEFLRGLAQDRAWWLIREAALDVIGAVAVPSAGPVAVNSDGRFETFGVTKGGTGGGTLVNAFQHVVGLGWSGWYPHPGSWPTGRQVATVRSPNGRLAVFATNASGQLMHSAQLPIGQGWTAPAPIGSFIATRPVVARNLDGRIEIVVVGLDGQLWHTWQTAPNGGWGPWAAFGGSFATEPAIGATADGRLVVVAVGTDGVLRGLAQVAPNSSWTAITTVPTPTPLTSPPAIGRNADGRLSVVAVGGGVLQHTSQVGFGWATMQPIGGAAAAPFAPAIGRNADGRLEVVYLDTLRRLSHVWQHTPNGAWSWPLAFGDRTMAMNPSIALNGDSRLEAFALGDDGQLWHTFQTSPSNGWSPLYSLGGDLSSG